MWRKVIAENAIANEKVRMIAGRVDAELRKDRLDHLGEKRLADPAETETRQRDAELACGEIGLEIGGDVLRQASAPAAFLDQRVELAAADFYQRKLRRDEEAVQEDENA